MNTGPQATEIPKPTNGRERPSRLIGGIVEHTAFSRRSVYNWIADNEVEYFRAPNGSIRIYLDSLKEKHMRRVHSATNDELDLIK